MNLFYLKITSNLPDFLEKFKFGRVWGRSVKHDGQKVLKVDHVLKDRDVLEIHLR